MDVSIKLNGINDFCVSDEGKLHLHSRFSRFLSLILPYYYQGKVDAIAKEMLNQLKNDYLQQKPSDLHLALRILELKPSQEIAAEIKIYARVLGCQSVQLDTVAKTELSQRLEKLGLTVEQQQSYPDLMKMIEVNQLVDSIEGVNWKIENEHWEGPTLSFAAEGYDEPVLFVNGAPKPWNAARKEIFGTDLDASTLWRLPREWRFDSQGITHYPASDWEKLTPCGKLLGHDGNFYLDIMSTTEGLNHNWIRLVDDKGEVISAGLGGKLSTVGMMRSSIGRLKSPDHLEFVRPNTHRKTRILIDADTFHSIKSRKIERDQEEHNLFFNLYSRNCSKYTCEVAAEAGLHLDNSEFPSQIIGRELFHRINLYPPKIVLEIMQKITHLVQTVLAAGFAFVVGAWYQNPDVKELKKSYSHLWKVQPNQPFSVGSLINGTTTRIASSMKVGAWQDFVEDYRSLRKAYLEGRRRELMQLGYFEDPKFQIEWIELERQAAYGMPPRLESNHLFLNDPNQISTDDLEDLINVLVAANHLQQR